MRSAVNASKEKAAAVMAPKRVDQVGLVGQAAGGRGLLRSSADIEVDHIVSLQRMAEMEGFSKLRLAECRALAVRSDNLIAMDAVANNSKRAYG